MAEFKLVISDPKARRAYQIEIKSPDADRLIGKKIGDIIKGELINIPGFEFKITGGSDKQGFPMRPDIPGTKRIRALLSSGPGIKIKRKGERRRKSVRGNQISEEIVQINMKIVEKPKTKARKEETEGKEKTEEKKETPKEEKKPEGEKTE